MYPDDECYMLLNFSDLYHRRTVRPTYDIDSVMVDGTDTCYKCVHNACWKLLRINDVEKHAWAKQDWFGFLSALHILSWHIQSSTASWQCDFVNHLGVLMHNLPLEDNKLILSKIDRTILTCWGLSSSNSKPQDPHIKLLLFVYTSLFSINLRHQ